MKENVDVEKRNEHRQILLSIKLYLHLRQMHRNSTSTQSTRDCIADGMASVPPTIRHKPLAHWQRKQARHISMEGRSLRSSFHSLLFLLRLLLKPLLLPVRPAQVDFCVIVLLYCRIVRLSVARQRPVGHLCVM